MEHCYGIVENIGSSENKAKHEKLFKNIVEFNGDDFIILTTCTSKEGLAELTHEVEEHKWKIATLTHKIKSNTYQILGVEDISI